MQEPGQAQQGSGEGLGGFGAKPGQAQQSSEEGSGEGLGGFGAEPCKSGATGLRRRFRGRSGRLWCRARSGFWRRFWRRSGRLFGADPAEVIPALGKNKTLRLLGIPPKLIFLQLHRLSIETRSKWIYWLFTAASHRIFLINMCSLFHVFQKPNGFTTKCRGSSLKESAIGPGNFTTKCLGFPALFRTNFYLRPGVDDES